MLSTTQPAYIACKNCKGAGAIEFCVYTRNHEGPCINGHFSCCPECGGAGMVKSPEFVEHLARLEAGILGLAGGER